jgi:hypothetical protein
MTEVADATAFWFAGPGMVMFFTADPAITDVPLRTLLRCEECLCVSKDKAQGWLSYIAFDPDDEQGEPLVVFYCPVCAAR